MPSKADKLLNPRQDSARIVLLAPRLCSCLGSRGKAAFLLSQVLEQVNHLTSLCNYTFLLLSLVYLTSGTRIAFVTYKTHVTHRVWTSSIGNGRSHRDFQYSFLFNFLGLAYNAYNHFLVIGRIFCPGQSYWVTAESQL